MRNLEYNDAYDMKLDRSLKCAVREDKEYMAVEKNNVY